MRKNKIQLQSAFKAAFYTTCKGLPRHMFWNVKPKQQGHLSQFKSISREQEGAAGRGALPLETSWYPQERERHGLLLTVGSS